MADQKISALPSYAGSTIKDNDLFIINETLNDGSQETRSVTAKKLGDILAPEVEGNRLASYMSFFNDPGGNQPDGSQGLRLKVDSWDSDAGTPKAVPGGEETHYFNVPAKSIGAYVFFTARMDQNPSDNWENNYNSPDGMATMKTFMRCNLTTPDCYWNTRATGNNSTTNGFAMRLISTIPTSSVTYNDKFQTYHAAKWDTIEWKSVDNNNDRTFAMTIKWYCDRANWVNLAFGMNRVIVIPLYEDPQTDPPSSFSYANPVDLVNAGELPSEYYLTDATHASEFDAVYSASMSSQSSKDELQQRTTDLKSNMDRLLERIQSYESAGGTDSNNLLAAAKAQLSEIKSQSSTYTTTDSLSELESLVNAQWVATAPVLNIEFGFENLLNTY